MKTIQAKITSTVLLVSLLSLSILSAVVLVNILGLKADVTSMSDSLGHTASGESQEAITQELYTQLTTIAQSNATLLDERLSTRQNYVSMSADYISSLYADDQQVDEATLVADTTLFLDTVLTHNTDLDALHYTSTSGLNLTVDGTDNEAEDGTEEAWYQDAVEGQALVWTDIADYGKGDGLYVSCSAPVYQDGQLVGVVGYDMTTQSIGGEIVETTVGESGYIFVVNETGRIIISSHLSVDVTGSVIRENILNGSDDGFEEISDNILNRQAGITQVNYQGQEVLMAYQPMDSIPWTVVVIMDFEEALEDAVAIGTSIDLSTGETVAQLTQATNDVILAITLVALLSILVIAVVSRVLAKRITRPLGHLIRGVEEIGSGNLDIYIMVATRDEIYRLSTAFNQMTGNLQTQMAELTAVTAEKERIGAELEVATAIQASMLPCIFPAFPEHTEFDVYATMEPAKEVGGDFYDFFLVDDTHLGLVMADVSGKGVPAALFMVIAKTLIKNHAQNKESPSQVLTNVNDQLCENNDAGMFVTCWMGILDLESGVLSYGNAGHNAPLLCRKGGQYEYIKDRTGFVLAGMEDMVYRQSEITLNKGDILYLYTDGVTEATDGNNELYNDDRLQDVLNVNRGIPLDQLLRAVKQDIDDFVGDAPQFDDITMLGIAFGEKES